MFVEESSVQFLRSKVHQQLEKISCCGNSAQKYKNGKTLSHFSWELSMYNFPSWPLKNSVVLVCFENVSMIQIIVTRVCCCFLNLCLMHQHTIGSLGRLNLYIYEILNVYLITILLLWVLANSQARGQCVTNTSAFKSSFIQRLWHAWAIGHFLNPEVLCVFCIWCVFF